MLALQNYGNDPDMAPVRELVMEETEAHTAQGQDQELALQIKALKAANKVIHHSLFCIYARQNFQYSSSPACSDLWTHAMTEVICKPCIALLLEPTLSCE